MLQRLRVQWIVLLSAFVVLVTISATATYWGAQTQRQDALVINLAGRQRMLVQRMTWQAQQEDETAQDELGKLKSIFSQTLFALEHGGAAPYLSDDMAHLPATDDAQILAALREVESSWMQYVAVLDELSVSDSDSLRRALDEQSAQLTQKTDEAVRLYEATFSARANRLRLSQIAFLLCALILLAISAWVARRSLFAPLRALELEAERLGADQLDAPVRVAGPREIRTLSQALDGMRSRLSEAREELVEWNDTLELRVAERTRELETLNEISREISSRLDIQQVLNSVTEKARALLGGEVASLCLVDENQNWLKLQTLSGPKNAVVGNVVRTDNPFAHAVLTDENAMICKVGACQGGCRMLSDEYRVSHLAAPLRVGERVIGALCVGSPTQNQFAAESADMLLKLASVAAIALENARLFAQAERAATLSERQRVAAEMHDGLGQTLSYLGLMTDQVVEFLADGREGAAVERLQKTRETISKATGDVRRAINRLLDETSAQHDDLWARLHETLDEVVSQYGLEAVWRFDEDSAPNPAPQIAEQVHHIAREALVNAARHANATRIVMQAGRGYSGYFVAIEDDGRGFEATQPAPSGHFGLQIMQARAKHIGGNVEIESAPGRGTRVVLTWRAEDDG
ncbi:MAG: GAF domain-containing protein [Anaerolineaceae bacterium]|nr:GAF domain-containing protein [Anaerolineaceae bacterium]